MIKSKIYKGGHIIMNGQKYVMLCEEEGKIMGRMLDSRGGNGGFIVFPHFNIENPKPGLLKIKNLIVKRNNTTKYGFVDGEYIIPDEIKLENLSNKHLYQLASMGFIEDLCSIHGYDYIDLKDPYVLDNKFYMALMVKGDFIFINKVNHLKKHSKHIKNLSHIERYLTALCLSTSMRATSYNISKKDMALSEDSIMIKNLDKIIWRKIVGVDNTDYCIALYRCKTDERFNMELYQDILNYNKETKEVIEENLVDILGEEHSDKKSNIMRSLHKYGM